MLVTLSKNVDEQFLVTLQKNVDEKKYLQTFEKCWREKMLARLMKNVGYTLKNINETILTTL
jgi:hypothetical protein